MDKKVITFMTASVLAAINSERVEANSIEQKICSTSTMSLDQFLNYYNNYATITGVVNVADSIRKEISKITLPTLRSNSLSLVDFFVDNSIELPDISPTEEDSVIFEFSENSLHFAIEVFNSGVISYFTNKNGKDEFLNFSSLNLLKDKLNIDLECQIAIG